MAAMHVHLRAVLVLVAGLLLAGLPFVSADTRQELSWLQGPLRIAQTWGLYGTAPRRRRHFEVWVDGALVYRAGDAAHRWRRAAFTYRRVRPLVVHTCMGDGKNQRPLVRWVLRKARADFPDAAEVAIRCTIGPWPMDEGEVEQELYVLAAAPDWGLRWTR